MASITARNHAALVKRNGTTVPEIVAQGNKAPRKTVAKGNQAVAAGNKAPAKVVAKSNDPKPTACKCGCGENANVGKAYRPGHDARHAGAVGRLLVAKAPTAKAEFDKLAPALQEKALRFEANRAAAAERKAAAAKLREDAKAALKAQLAAL